MAAASAPSPPPPPPPPPLLDNNSTTSSVSNGPTINQAQTAVDGNGTKPWERAWSVDEMRKGATTWSLASDAGLLHYLQEFSQNMISQTHKIEQKVDGLVHDTKGISAKVHNTFNDFLMLSNTQFIENRVYDEEETKDEEVKSDETNSQEKEKTREELETEVIPKINEAINSGLSVLDSAFVTVEITPEEISDEEEEGNLPENLRPEPLLELTDVYAHRKLPAFIGTPEFHNDDLVGLHESSSGSSGDEDQNDEEMESKELESSEDEKSSESETDETMSASSSNSEETSSSSETDEEKEVVQRKKPRKQQESEDETDSDGDLFATGTKEKLPRSEEDEESDESDESANEIPRKSAAPMDFSAELAAKLGGKMRKPEDSDNDHDENDDDMEQEEIERPGDEQDKDELFTASVATTSSVTSKGRKKKHKKSKSRSSSQASHESGATAAVPSAIAAALASEVASRHPPMAHSDMDDNEWEESGKHDDQQDDLFTSSIDTTSSVVSKSSRGSRHKHKHKKRSDSQLSNASLKSDKGQKETKKVSSKSEPSPEGDLFDEEDVSSPFGKKGGMFSGGSGLFDEVDEDNNEPKSNIVDQDSHQRSQDHDENDRNEVVKSKPKTSPSGKKLPAGAVAIFGDHGPLGHVPPVHSSDQTVEKNAPSEKKSDKAKSGGGGLFSDDGDDFLSVSQSSSVVSSKPPAKKPSKEVDLFGDDGDDGDDDSLFSAKPAKKEQEPKSQPSKKKLPVGAVSMFGASPPPLFNTSPTDDEPVESVKPSTANISIVKSAPAKKGSGLFDEGDKTSSSSSVVAPAVVPVAAKPKRKTNQISLFDDKEEEEEEDGDDLFASFASIVPSKGMTTNKTQNSAPVEEKKTAPSKPAPKISTIGLFDDDDDDEDEDDLDIFSTKPSLSSTNKEKSAEERSLAKPTMSTSGLFDSEDHDLFSEPVQKDQNKQDSQMNKPAVKAAKPAVKAAKLPSSTLVDTEDHDDLFSEPKTKATFSDPLLMNEEVSPVSQTVKPTAPKRATSGTGMENNLFTEPTKESPDPLLVQKSTTSSIDNTSKQDIQKPSVEETSGEQNDDGEKAEDDGEKAEVDGLLSQNNKDKSPSKPSKKLPGAVSLFGGIDIFAGQKPGKAKPQQQGSGLFSDEEGDVFATTSPPPKHLPPIAQRPKPPKKQAAEIAQVTTSSPLSEAKVPVQPAKPIVAVSSSDKNSSVDKLQNTLMFNPATMLPGAVPPPRKQNDVAQATFDKPAAVKTLESSSKDRVRIRAKRRPPTRQARRTAARGSMDDTSLFGSDISATIPSPLANERLSEGSGKKEPLFSDSDDLLSSNSYKAMDKTDGRHAIPQATQSNTFKSDPLLDSSKTTAVSSASLFEDSVESAMSEDKINFVVEDERLKENVPEVEKQETAIKTTNESLFDDSVRDDLFGRSTEDTKPSSQKVVGLIEDEDEDDLFKSSRPLFSPPPLDFDSEASASGDFSISQKPKPPSDLNHPATFSEVSKFEPDIFAPVSSAVKVTEKKKEEENKKEDQENGDNKTESKPKSDAKKTNVVDDLFGDTGSMFDDIPKKPKEKKKKKATTSKENIFDEPSKDSIGDEDTTSVKTTKKTKTKKKVEKKGKSKMSIFDDDSPSIFDDPLNATSK